MSEVPQGEFPGGGQRKPSYRVLLFDEDRTVHSNVPIPVSDDAAAKAVARRMSNGLSAELWDGLRYIDQFYGMN